MKTSILLTIGAILIAYNTGCGWRSAVKPREILPPDSSMVQMMEILHSHQEQYIAKVSAEIWADALDLGIIEKAYTVSIQDRINTKNFYLNKASFFGPGLKYHIITSHRLSSGVEIRIYEGKMVLFSTEDEFFRAGQWVSDLEEAYMRALGKLADKDVVSDDVIYMENLLKKHNTWKQKRMVP